MHLFNMLVALSLMLMQVMLAMAQLLRHTRSTTVLLQSAGVAKHAIMFCALQVSRNERRSHYRWHSAAATSFTLIAPRVFPFADHEFWRSHHGITCLLRLQITAARYLNGTTAHETEISGFLSPDSDSHC